MARVHTRDQEMTGAYVYSLNFRNSTRLPRWAWAAMIFTPIKDYGTTLLDTKQNTNIGGLFGAGVAYELSPSFDVRAEYRGVLVKAPDFGLDELQDESVRGFLDAGDWGCIPLLGDSGCGGEAVCLTGRRPFVLGAG